MAVLELGLAGETLSWSLCESSMSLFAVGIILAPALHRMRHTLHFGTGKQTGPGRSRPWCVEIRGGPATPASAVLHG